MSGVFSVGPPKTTLDVRSFGAIADDTSKRAVNHAAFQAAIDAACAQDIPLEIPDGNFHIDSGGAFQLRVTTGRLRMFGQGKKRSRLTIGAVPFLLTYSGIRVEPPGHLDVEDITIAGSPTPQNTATTGKITLSFSNATKRITRASGSFVADGIVNGNKVNVAGFGTPVSEFTLFTLVDVQPLYLQVAPSDTLPTVSDLPNLVVDTRVYLSIGIQVESQSSTDHFDQSEWFTYRNVDLVDWCTAYRGGSGCYSDFDSCYFEYHCQGTLIGDGFHSYVRVRNSFYRSLDDLFYGPQHSMYCNVGSSMHMKNCHEIGVARGEGYAFEHFNTTLGPNVGTITALTDQTHFRVSFANNLPPASRFPQRMRLSRLTELLDVASYTSVSGSNTIFDVVLNTAPVATLATTQTLGVEWVPFESVFDNCSVEDRTGGRSAYGPSGQGFNSVCRYAKTTYINCRVGNCSGDQLCVGEGGAIVTDCIFRGTCLTAIRDGAGADGGAWFQNCDVDVTATTYAVQISSSPLAGGKWLFSGGRYKNRNPGGDTIIVAASAGTIDVTFDNVEIVTAAASTFSGLNFNAGGILRLLNGTKFSGGQGLYITGDADLALTLELGDVEFAATNSNSGFWVNWDASGATLTVVPRGWQRYTGGGTGPAIGCATGSVVKGSLQPLPGIGTIASATTLNLSPNCDTYHVTGTTTIETINVLESGGGSLPAKVADVIPGPFRIICDGAAVFSDAGNIRPVKTTARTATDMLQFLYDKASGKWYELGSR